MTYPSQLRKFLAIGSGIGIEVSGPHGSESLHISAVRVRPNGACALARLDIEDFPHQPAAVWGADYARFTRKTSLRHVAASVILPRQDVIVRQLHLPGVSNKDLAAAVQFQLEGLHPYPDDDVVASWSRLGNTPAVLVAIARRATVERYATLFDEAGVKTGSFTCSAAAIYSALRLFDPPPPAEILASSSGPESGDAIEFYGESPARPLFSATFAAGTDPIRAATLACAELRIDPPIDPRPLEDMLRVSPAIPYAAALASACPRLSLALNLLPAERRQASSRALWIPSAALGTGVLMLAGALAAFPSYENRKYVRSLEAEIARVQPVARRAAALDHDAETARRRASQLDDFRRRAKSDMDVLVEMTRILPPPTWLNLLEINRTQVYIGGDTDQAAPLLKTIDASPLFEASEFAGPPIRTPTGEIFRIRTNREAGR